MLLFVKTYNLKVTNVKNYSLEVTNTDNCIEATYAVFLVFSFKFSLIG